MPTRPLRFVGITALALVATASRAADAAAAPPAAAGPNAYAVLKSPLPGDAGPCATSALDAEHVKATLVSPETGACPVARVGGELVGLGELAKTLLMSHEASTKGSAAPVAKGVGTNLDKAVNRLVEVRLLVQEARDMGLADLPDVRKAIGDFEGMSLRAALERRATEGVRPDEREVQQLYEATVREWKLRSLLFPKKPDADAFAARVRKGEKFEVAGAAAVAARSAQGSPEADWVRSESLVPEIRAAVAKLKKGAVSAPIATRGGSVVARLEDVRYPDDPEARAKARDVSYDRQRFKALSKYYAGLAKRYAVVDRALLKRLDFEAKKPGFAALKKDARVLARIEGGDSLKVSDLADALSKKFFHGMERPIVEKRVNPQKVEVFDAMLRDRVAQRQIAVDRLAEAPEHRRRVDEYTSAVLFSTFLEKVLVPDVKISEADAKKYWEQHQPEFTKPEMYQLQGLGFRSAKHAQAALEQLRGGTDLAWLRSNADGQLKPDEPKLELDGRTVSATSLPEGLAKALTGSNKGDYRLYSAGAQHYVVHVVEAFPRSVQPYAEAREAVAKKLFADKLGEAVHDYAAQLRKARPVEIYITRIES